jgi:hypothetical protein
LTELLPEDNVLRRGFEEGAEAAREAVASKKVEAASAARLSTSARKKSGPVATNTTKPKQRRTLPKPRKAGA